MKKLQQLKIKQGFDVKDLEIEDTYSRLERKQNIDLLIKSSNYKLTTI